jgi:hypothetical protein
MLQRLYDSLQRRPSTRALKKLIVICIILLAISSSAVIYVLGLSNFPGTLEKTQLGFDGQYIQSCFSAMNEDDLSLFIVGNLVDYVFMVSYGGLLFGSALILSRQLRSGSTGEKLGHIVSVLGLIAACSDGLENVFLLSMAINPSNFPTWLGVPHSLFAYLKFSLMYISAGWVILTLGYLALRRKINTVLKVSAHQGCSLPQIHFTSQEHHEQSNTRRVKE